MGGPVGGGLRHSMSRCHGPGMLGKKAQRNFPSAAVLMIIMKKNDAKNDNDIKFMNFDKN